MSPRRLARCASAALLLLTIACGGNKSAPPPPPVVAGSVTPATANLLQGATQQFAATVTNAANIAVSWSVQEGSAGGTVDATGKYTAPNAAGTFHVIATSQADTTKAAIAIVTVPEVVVTVTPSSAEIVPGPNETFTLTATVSGHVNPGVTWSVQEPTGGYVFDNHDGTATFQLGGVITIFHYHVLATSVGNPTRTGTTSVHVQEFVITPSAPTLYQGTQVELSLYSYVYPTPQLTWSLQEGATAGSLNVESYPSDGTKALYTAHAAGAYHVTVSNTADPSMRAMVPVTVSPLSGLRTDPATEVLGPGSTRSFFAVAPDNAHVVAADWRLLDGSGSIRQTGVLTAPTTPGTYHVQVSSQDAPVTASAIVTVANSGYFTPFGTRASDLIYAAVGLPNGGALLLESMGTALYDSGGDYSDGPALPEPYTPYTAGRSMTALADGKVLIAGGYIPIDYTHGYYLNVAYLFDPATNQFQPFGNLAYGRCCAHTATRLDATRVLIAGGLSGATAATAEICNEMTLTCTAVGSMAQARQYASASLLPSGKVLVAGGFNGNLGGEAFATSEIFDPQTGVFSPGPNMNFARAAHAAVSLPDGTVLVAGGASDAAIFQGTSEGHLVQTAEIYDPAANRFRRVADLPAAAQATAALLPDGRVLVVGGNPAAVGARVAVLYDPGTATFIPTGGTENPHTQFPWAATLKNGSVLVGDGGIMLPELYHSPPRP